jgi:hypothetical protein
MGINFYISIKSIFMPKQQGIFPLTGNMGRVSFYRDKIHGFVVRRKGGPSPEQVKTSSQLERMRENSSEFGRASRFCGDIRSGFGMVLRRCSDYWTSRRMGSLMLKVLKADPVSPRGERVVQETPLRKHLKDFRVNTHLDITAFVSQVQLRTLDGVLEVKTQYSSGTRNPSATHWQATSAYLNLSPGVETKVDVQQTEMTKVGLQLVDLEFRHAIAAGVGFHCMTVHHFQEVNGALVELRDEEAKAGVLNVV